MKPPVCRGGRLDSNADTTVQLVMDDGTLYPEIGKINFQSTFIDPEAGDATVACHLCQSDEKLLPGQFLRLESVPAS